MLKSIRINNFKSIEDVRFDLGRINVFIGENGSGKSNILEAIALAGAARANKLDNEFLVSRGIRVTSSQFMKPAFSGTLNKDPIRVTVEDQDGSKITYVMSHGDQPYSGWSTHLVIDSGKERSADEIQDRINREISSLSESEYAGLRTALVKAIKLGSEQIKETEENNEKAAKLELKFEIKETAEKEDVISKHAINALINMMHAVKGVDLDHIEKFKDFIIYSPENSSLRTLEKEGQIQPLGINGEGLFKLLTVIANDEDKTRITAIKRALEILGWFVDFRISKPEIGSIERLEVQDKFLQENNMYFDQRSSNEGFLFLAFYFSLFCSNLTPSMFAIDNIDASLNPKICEHLMIKLSGFANEYDKQVVLTTHNPAILDGLDLNDENQKLFVIYRGFNGQTMIRPVKKPKYDNKSSAMRLSEMFMSGLIGGITKAGV